MKAMMKETQRVLARVWEANLRMEHYWFYPKLIAVTEKPHAAFTWGKNKINGMGNRNKY